MFFEGARWNSKQHILDNSEPKELYTDAPLIHFVPIVDREAPESVLYFII